MYNDSSNPIFFLMKERKGTAWRMGEKNKNREKKGRKRKE